MKYRYTLEFETADAVAPEALATLHGHLDAQVEILSDDFAHDYTEVKSSLTEVIQS